MGQDAEQGPRNRTPLLQPPCRIELVTTALIIIAALLLLFLTKDKQSEGIWICLWGTSVPIWVITTHEEVSPYLFVKNNKFVCMYIHTIYIYNDLWSQRVGEKFILGSNSQRTVATEKKVEMMLKWILCQLFSLLDSLLRLQCIWRIQRMRAFRIKI